LADCCCFIDRVTEGVAYRDMTDAVVCPRPDSTNDSTSASQSRTHEKADMVVVSAAYPGDP